MPAPGRVQTNGIPPRMLKVTGLLLAAWAAIASGAFAYGLAMVPQSATWGATIGCAAGLLLIVIALAFIKGGAWQANSALTILSAGASLFILNLLLMAVTPREPIDSARAAANTGAPFDMRTPIEVLQDFRSGGVHAYPRAPIQLLLGRPELREDFAELLPLGGIAHAPTVLCNESGEYVVYRSDRYGFNNDDSVYDSPGGVDLLVVGDSFAQGYCVPPGEDVAGRLRGLGAAAVTIGNGGNGPLLELASLIEYGEAWRPPVVLWLYYAGNDLVDLFDEQGSAPLLRYLDGFRQNLPARQDEVDALLQRIFKAEYGRQAEETARQQTEHARERLRSFMTQLKQMLTLYDLRRRLQIDRQAVAADEAGMLALFERVLKVAEARVEGWGGELHAVYLPDWQSFAQRPSVTRDRVLAAFNRAGIPVVDFERRLQDTGDPLNYFPFRLPNHYTTEGYRILAEQIWNAVGRSSGQGGSLQDAASLAIPGARAPTSQGT